MIKMLRLSNVMELTGNSRSGVYLKISKGLFPAPVKIGDRAAAWPENEIEAINAAIIEGYSKEKLKELVAILESNRKRATLKVSR